MAYKRKTTTTENGESYAVYFQEIVTERDAWERNGQRATLQVQFVVEHVTETGKRTVRSAPSPRYDDPFTLADAAVTAAMVSQGSLADGPYGMEFEYRQPYTVDASRCRMMAKTFDRVERGTKRLEAQMGYPKTFGQFVGRVAMALGIERGVWKLDAGTGPRSYGTRWDDSDYRFGTLGALVDYIDSRVAAWQREHAPKPEEGEAGASAA